ncbi:VanZ family protein [Desulfobotulus sp. H1]|uniref:VanZ family protein n=1 Tax=Desulfobotulus pelophilus TaxID=2823377 RepID=A0ABT3NBP7_9BACT|nr:VanZ family protein [Desulfobotulus pelophilus]MCW7754895.1 VanZ family protein [Desulfobotulus pelophilus]
MADLLALTVCLVIATLVTSKYMPNHQALALRAEAFVGGYVILHRVAGAVFTLSVVWLCRVHRWPWWGQGFLFAAILTVFALDEWIQSIIPHRHGCLQDFYNSAIGWGTALAIWGIARFLWKLHAKKEEKRLS